MSLYDLFESIVRTQFPLYNNIAFLSDEKESADFIKYALKTKGYAELHLFVASSPFPLTWTFSRNVNIYEVQAVIADAIAVFGGSGNAGTTVQQTSQQTLQLEKPVFKKSLADLEI